MANGFLDHVRDIEKFPIAHGYTMYCSTQVEKHQFK